MQTFIDRYIEQGRQQGRQEGRQEGKQEGGANVLLRLIERKFGPPSESVRARTARADPQNLARLVRAHPHRRHRGSSAALSGTHSNPFHLTQPRRPVRAAGDLAPRTITAMEERICRPGR
jgi:hypothetical protein